MLTDTGRVHSNGVTRETRRMSPMDFIVRQMEAAKRARGAMLTVTEREDMAVDAVRSGKTLWAACRTYDVPYRRLGGLCKACGVPFTARPSAVRMTPAIRTDIVRMLSEHATRQMIHAKHGVSLKTVSRIRREEDVC